ncbi:hypothetical protein B0H13DRAFT_2404434 [Mycena leptocephala]|nr:hypothetical protein B0H13DRAFT_2404434 [Mycena leptocephala]
MGTHTRADAFPSRSHRSSLLSSSLPLFSPTFVYELGLRIQLGHGKRGLRYRGFALYEGPVRARGQGQHPKITTVEEKNRQSAARYRAARKALVGLGKLLKKTEWESTLLPLATEDVLGMPRALLRDPECKKWLMKKGPEARRNAKKAGEEARLAKDEFISMERAAMGVLPEEEEYLAALPEEKRCGGGRAAGPAKTPSAVASARPPRVVKRRCTADSDSRPCSFSTESRAPQRLGPSARTSLRPSCTPVNAPAPVRAASAAAHRLPPLPLRPTRARAVTPKPEREHLSPTVPHPHHRPVRPHGFEGRGGWGGWLRCGRAGTSSRTPRGVQRGSEGAGMVDDRGEDGRHPERGRSGFERRSGRAGTSSRTRGFGSEGAEGGGMVEVRAGGDFIPNARVLASWSAGDRRAGAALHPERPRSGFERRRWRDIEGAGGRSQTPAVGLRRAQKARGWPMTKAKTDVIQNAGFGIRKAQQAGGRRGVSSPTPGLAAVVVRELGVGGRDIPSPPIGRLSFLSALTSVVPLRPLALGLGTSFLLDFVPFRLRARCTLTMPKAQQEPGRRERRRRRELAAITRIRDPIEQCLAHIATPRHKDHGGELYTVFRIERVFCERLQLEIDKLEVKTGYSIDTLRRQFEYRENCTGVEFIWCYKYTCDNVKLLERLVHLTLRARGAAIAPYPCPGCGVKHREFYLDAAAGGIDGVCEVIEFWLGALGQAIDRQHAGFYQYGSYMDYDGQNFGTRSERLKIPPFDGSLHIAGLSFAPLEMRTRKDEIRAALMKRGKRFQTMRGQCHGEYTGVAIEEDEEKDKKFSIKSRVMIDGTSYNRMCADFAWEASEDEEAAEALFWAEDSLSAEEFAAFKAKQAAEKAARGLTDEETLLATNVLRGFSFADKKWFQLFIENFSEIVWNEASFDRLVLPETSKTLIRALAKDEDWSPSYTVRLVWARHSHLEQELTRILDLAHTWNAIDEADRNALVSVFLRLLEYYEGILFLTTNRVNTTLIPRDTPGK